MKAFILPTTRTEDLAPLTSWMAEFLLPVVNKPVVEHLIELLARHHVEEIVLIVKHLPFETEQYFGDGSRWGVRLSYALVGSYRGMADALGRIDPGRLEGPFLCLPADLLTDLDLSALAQIQRQGPDDAVLAIPGDGSDSPLRPATARELETIDRCPTLMTRAALQSLARAPSPGADREPIDRPAADGATFQACRLAFTSQTIESLPDLAAANRRVLEGDFKTVLIPGKQVKPGYWLGRHCQIHPGARMEAPLLIGNHCSVQEGSAIGPGSVIGDLVIVDRGATIRDSVVLSHTYLGAYTDIGGAILKRNWMFQVPRQLHVYLGDDLMIGDLEKRMLTIQGGRLLNAALAWALLALASPLWIPLLLYHLLVPSRKLLLSEKRVRGQGKSSLDGSTEPRTFGLFRFDTGHRLIRKIPGLINVIRGDLNLVGVSPLDGEAVDRLPEAWRKMRAHAPLGLFHLWELEGRTPLEWEEKMAMESYYAAARSTAYDLKIFARALLTLLTG